MPPDLSTPPRDDLVMKILIAITDTRHRRVRGHPGSSPVPCPAHAGVDQAQGERHQGRRQQGRSAMRSAWWWTPSYSGSTRWSAGWTRPRAGCGARPSTARCPAAPSPQSRPTPSRRARSRRARSPRPGSAASDERSRAAVDLEGLRQGGRRGTGERPAGVARQPLE